MISQKYVSKFGGQATKFQNLGIEGQKNLWKN